MKWYVGWMHVGDEDRLGIGVFQADSWESVEQRMEAALPFAKLNTYEEVIDFLDYFVPRAGARIIHMDRPEEATENST